MDRQAGIQVDGSRQLRTTLRKAGDDLKEMSAAHKAAAQIAATASAALAPVGTGPNGGRLVGTIRAAGTKTAGIIRAGKKSVPYAAPIHWGWPTRPKPYRRWYGGPIFPQPFLAQGAQDSEGRWIRVYQDYLDQALEKIEGAKK